MYKFIFWFFYKYYERIDKTKSFFLAMIPTVLAMFLHVLLLIAIIERFLHLHFHLFAFSFIKTPVGKKLFEYSLGMIVFALAYHLYYKNMAIILSSNMKMNNRLPLKIFL